MSIELKFKVKDLYDAMNCTIDLERDLDKILSISVFNSLRKDYLERNIDLIRSETNSLYETFQKLNLLSMPLLDFFKAEPKTDINILRPILSILKDCNHNPLDIYLELGLSDKELVNIISILDEEIIYNNKAKKSYITLIECLRYYLKYVKTNLKSD